MKFNFRQTDEKLFFGDSYFFLFFILFTNSLFLEYFLFWLYTIFLGNIAVFFLSFIKVESKSTFFNAVSSFVSLRDSWLNFTQLFMGSNNSESLSMTLSSCNFYLAIYPLRAGSSGSFWFCSNSSKCSVLHFLSPILNIIKLIAEGSWS